MIEICLSLSVKFHPCIVPSTAMAGNEAALNRLLALPQDAFSLTQEGATAREALEEEKKETRAFLRRLPDLSTSDARAESLLLP